MARPLRLEFAGALDHVTARGNERRSIFLGDADGDRAACLGILGQTRKGSGLFSAKHSPMPRRPRSIVMACCWIPQGLSLVFCRFFARKTLVDFSMPTLLWQDGFQFFFYANEHEPKHVHVAKGDDYAKIELHTFAVKVDHMKPKDLKKALAVVKLHNLEFEERWDEWQRKR
jgi:hypothetical protein